MAQVRKGKVNRSPDPKFPGGASDFSTDSPDAKKYLWAGKIIHVDTETMVCSVSFDSGLGERHDVPLPAPGGGGPRSWAGTVLEPGSKVIIAWRKYGNRAHVPHIVEVLTAGVFPAREYEPWSAMDPSDAAYALEQQPELEDDPHYNFKTVRLKLKKAYPGDFMAQSSGGADVLLDRDANISNRAGNEFKLRDSDQTAILQSLNEFTSNAAGYYRRGLIRRNGFTFLQDLFPLSDLTDVDRPYDVAQAELFAQKVSPDSPAYDILRQFGLITVDGTKNFGPDQGINEYPYVVTSDGHRANYVVQGENVNSFSTWPWCYVEDRKELRHVSNGVMAVTEEGDGFQVDLDKEVFIEDVHGTVVGNDFQTDAGRPLYKRILGMKVFTDPDQGVPSDGPIFEAVDMVDYLPFVDHIGLARLYRMQSPNSSNQYAFGITKEGKVLLHVPMTQVGSSQQAGKSVEANIMGLVKAIIGKDPNTQLSADIKLQGGLNLEIGRGPGNASIELVLHGPVKKRIINDDDTGQSPAEETVVGGSSSRTVAGSAFDYVNGNSVRISGALDATEADGIQHNAGTGGYKFQSAGDVGRTVLGKTTEQFGLLHTSAYAVGSVKTSLAGIDASTVLAGAMARTVVAGAGIADTVTAGNIATTVATGNMLMSVGAGNLAATVGVGNLALTASAGALALTSSLSASLTAGVNASINAPTTKIGLIIVGGAVAGIPGPPAPHLDYITGLPILGLPTITLGLFGLPISSPITTPIFRVNLLGAGMLGPSANQLAVGLANGLFQYASAGMKVQTVDVGVLGVGTGIGIAVLTPASLIPALSGSFPGHSILGIMSQPLAIAVASAFSQCFALAIVSTISPTVGVGAGVGTIIPTYAAPFFIAGFRAAGMNGPTVDLLATAIGDGLDFALPSTIVTVAIAGSPSIVPSGGSGSGSIF